MSGSVRYSRLWVEFSTRATGPERLIAEAEVHFDGGIMGGLKLVGFTLWRSAEDEVYVTLPSQAGGSGGERRFFDFVRGDSGSLKGLREWILAEWRRDHPALLPGAASS